MKVIMNIFFTILILAIAFISIRFIWVNNVDYLELFKSKLPKVPVKKEVPVPDYGIHSLSFQYEAGLMIDDIEWRNNYSQHILTIVNQSDEDFLNSIVSIHLPAGIVKSKVETSVNVFNVNLSSFKQPISLGKTKIEETFSNSLDISIEKMNKHSTLTIELILDYRSKPKEWWNKDQGYWLFDISYEYKKKKGEKIRNRIINPVKIISEIPLSIFVEKETDYVDMENIKGTQDTYPFSPIISNPDGRFIQIENFNGSFENIKLSKGEGLLNSIGIDYPVNTDKNYK